VKEVASPCILTAAQIPLQVPPVMRWMPKRVSPSAAARAALPGTALLLREAVAVLFASVRNALDRATASYKRDCLARHPGRGDFTE
jgi:hypothetical protein